jgi:hypothetical protein
VLRCRPGVQGQHAWAPDQRRTVSLRSTLRRIRGTADTQSLEIAG